MSSDTRTIQCTQCSLRLLYVTRSMVHYWLPIFIAAYGFFNALPFLTPGLMKIG